MSRARDPQNAANIHSAQQAGIQLKQVRIALRDGEAIVGPGALRFLYGRIEMESRIGGVAGLGKEMMSKFVTKEAAVMPRWRGIELVYLEPPFSHFLIYHLTGEELIAEEGTLEVGSPLQKTSRRPSAAARGFSKTGAGHGHRFPEVANAGRSAARVAAYLGCHYRTALNVLKDFLSVIRDYKSFCREPVG